MRIPVLPSFLRFTQKKKFVLDSVLTMMIILGTVWSFVPKKSDSFPFAVQLQTIEVDKVDQEFSGEIWSLGTSEEGKKKKNTFI